MTDTSTWETPTTAATLYELRGVGRRYLRGSAEVAALRDLDLDIAAGEFLSIEGPSGSGKSTLLQLLGALDTPTSGTIAFDGRPLGTASDAELTALRSRSIGFVFQQFNLVPTLSALDNVELAMVPTTRNRRERRQRATTLLAQVGLGHRVEHLPSRLSGGEQQRVAIARALANRPKVIVADEPTGNLDSESAGEIMGVLAHLMDTEAVTVIVATHDPEVAGNARRRLRLRDGALVDDARTAEAPSSPGDAAVVLFDLDGTVRHWSRGATALFGYGVAAVVGSPLSLLGPGVEGARRWAGFGLEAAGADESRAALVAARTADGTEQPMAARFTAVRGAGGRLQAVAVTWWRPGPDDEGLPVVG